LPDIVFVLDNNKYAIVEIETTDPVPSAYQSLKYRPLLCAELGLALDSPDVDTFLIAWETPEDVKGFCKRYGIKFMEKRL